MDLKRSYLWMILGVVVVILCLSIFLKRCNIPKNGFVKSNSDTSFIYQDVYLKDSSKYTELEAKLVSSRKKIFELQDSLQKAITKNANLVTEGLITWKQQQVYTNLKGTYSDDTYDSLKLVFLQSHVLADSLIYDNISKNYLKVPTSFTVKDKWLYEKGTITKQGVNLDSVTISSSPTVMFGEKYKKFLGIKVGRPTIITTISDANPHTNITTPKSYLYTPSKHNISLTIGPSVVYDGQFKFGVGATLGWRIF